ncbi:hypothetical protein WISP_111898 [Willisornis vidua]|uniref:Uncharacterized protein n=1 Tax=Willisornis vidua TaxID=1566151 RepID=A0ABQ9CW52_9PASS|nr:hypothetical protein WISP_111898 [Willisornis vidua]
METVLRSWVCLPEGTVLLAVERRQLKEVGLEGGYGLCMATGTPEAAESLIWAETHQLRSSRKAVTSLVLELGALTLAPAASAALQAPL